ncbi:hypothetical protein SLS62_003248 [Diatrype stigma]|uniref:Uncharacterized protein n=1 Tax=Diatrype stigma TaxID=117547 RepID=A0AAN9UVF3_9PEZI
MTRATPPRRFAPLKESSSLPGSANNSGLPRLQGIVFDVDGTLCEPQNHMFAEMRAALGIPKSVDILEHVYGLPTAEAQEAGMKAIRDIESRNMVAQVAQPGLATLMSYLDGRGVRKAICTRNFQAPVAHLLAKFLAGSVFEPVVTRDFRPPKPDPAGILHIARSWGLVRKLGAGGDGEQLVRAAHQGSEEEIRGALGTATATTTKTKENGNGGEEGEGEEVEVEVGDASALIMVGDSIDDMTAGRRAGAATVLLVNDANRELADHAHTDLVIGRLDELIGVLEDGFVGREKESEIDG